MSDLVRYILIAVGALLLLPGFCSLYFIFEIGRTPGNVFELGGLFIVVWGASFLITALGVWLIRTAVKRPSRPAA
jgi:hypothetical protein